MSNSSDQFPLISRRGQGRDEYGGVESSDFDCAGIITWMTVMLCLVCIVVSGALIMKAFHS